MSYLRKGLREMEEDPKNTASEYKKRHFSHNDTGIMANKGSIDSRGSGYCNLEESGGADLLIARIWLTLLRCLVFSSSTL